MWKFSVKVAVFVVALSGCSEEKVPAAAAPAPRWVKTLPVERDPSATLRLSGTIRGRHEIPLAFEVGGRIAARLVDAGDRVEAGQVLLRLDPADLVAEVDALRAQAAAADTALAIAQSDLTRNRELVAKRFISQQGLERAELALREASTRLEAARARLRQAEHRQAHATLQAQRAGVLMNVSGEPGQVVAAGQSVALLARGGAREVEVFFPDGTTPPAAGRMRLGSGIEYDIVLRETAGSADPQSLTWRTRYRVAGAADQLPLGSVVSVEFQRQVAAGALHVPIAALDERGEGALVWRVVDGRAQPLPVEVLALDAETATIRADLPDETPIIVLGTHLLEPGLPVREQSR